MVSFTELPVNFFERSLSDEELYIDIYRYHAHTIEKEGFYVRGEWVSAKKINLNSEETFYVPSLIFVYDRQDFIRGIDVVVFAYLCYVAYKNKTGTVKVDVGEISRKTKIKKTQVRISINNLIREEFLLPSPVSGYFIIGELKYPDLWLQYEDILQYLLK